MRPLVLPTPSGHRRKPALGRLARRLAPLRRLVLCLGLAVLASLVLAEPVRADNCGDPSDCFGVQRSALAATVGVLALTALSLLLDFTPIVGTVKGLIEGITGRDVITGERLEDWERAIGWIPFVGKAGKVGRIGGALDDVGDVSRRGDELSDLSRGAPERLTPNQPREPVRVGGRTTEASPSQTEARGSGDGPSGGRAGGRDDGSDGGSPSPEPRARSGRGAGDERSSPETPGGTREPTGAGGQAPRGAEGRAEARDDGGGGAARGGSGGRDGGGEPSGGPGRGDPGGGGGGPSGGRGGRGPDDPGSGGPTRGAGDDAPGGPGAGGTRRGPDGPGGGRSDPSGDPSGGLVRSGPSGDAPLHVGPGDELRGQIPLPQGTAVGTLPADLLSGGQLVVNDLMAIVPRGTPNTFVPSARLPHGFKFEFRANGIRHEVKFHGPDPGAPEGSNSASGWTAQTRIGNRYLRQNGTTTRNRTENAVHVPLDL